MKNNSIITGVASEIFYILGGQNFEKVANVANFRFNQNEDWLQMDLKTNALKCNRLKITKQLDGLYTMLFFKIRFNMHRDNMMTVDVISTIVDVHSAELLKYFEKETGLPIPQVAC